MYLNRLSPALQVANTAQTSTDKEMSMKHLKEVALEFEATLTATVLKEGLKAADEINKNDSGGGNDTYKNFAYEQIAYQIGKQGILGIADEIVNSISPALPKGRN